MKKTIRMSQMLDPMKKGHFAKLGLHFRSINALHNSQALLSKQQTFLFVFPPW